MLNEADNSVRDSLLSLRPQIIKMGGPHLGDELFSEVCLRALHGNYSHPGSILQIAKSYRCDLWRKENVRRHLSIGTNPDLQGRDENPQRELENMERKEALDREVARLSPKYREIIDLIRHGDLSDQEISRKLNRPLGTIRSQKWRAIRGLKLFLQPHR